MSSNGNTVFTKKLRLAIKAKIHELGVDADDELPDYVMVLAANRKNKARMKGDLELFMGKSTSDFVDWLFDAFERIQKGIPNQEVQKQEAQKSSKVEERKLESSAGPSRRSPVRTVSISSGDLNDEPATKKKKKKHLKKADSKKQEESVDNLPDEFLHTFKQVEGPKVKHSHPRITAMESPSPKSKKMSKHKKHKSHKRSRSPTHSKHSRHNNVDEDNAVASSVPEREERVVQVCTFKPRLMSKIGQVVVRSSIPRDERFNYNSSDEYDEYENDVRQPRQMERAVVAPSAAIFKRVLSSTTLDHKVGRRVEEAKESTLVARQVSAAVHVDPPDPESAPTNTNNVEKTARKRRADNPLRAVARLMGLQTPRKTLVSEATKKPALSEFEPEENVTAKKPKQEKTSDQKQRVQNSPTRKQSAGSDSVLQSEPASSTSLGNWNGQITIEEDSTSEDEAEIDAVLASAFKERHKLGQQIPPTAALSRPHLNPAEQQALQMLLAQTTALQNQPINERCRFWPGCTKPACSFVHPSKACAKFPFCNFGKKCLYIHPPCKFGAACVRPSCPYTHDNISAVAKLIATSAPYTGPKHTILCKFHGRCENPACEFKHPPPCRFGANCSNPGCTFLHRVTAKNQKADLSKFQWVNPNQS